MRSRHFPTGNGGRDASIAVVNSSRARGASLLVFAVALVVSGCGGGSANLLEPPSFITGARPSPGAASYEPVTGETEAGKYAFPWDLYDEDDRECRMPDPPPSCPPVRIGIEDTPVAFTAVSAPKLSAKSGHSTPVASTGLRAPAAYGALDERLTDLTMVGFDARNFPFRFPLSDFVHDTAGLEPEVPEFLTDASSDAACHPLLRLAPGLVCSPWAPDGSLHALASPDGTGAYWRFSDGVSLSAFTRHRGRLDGAASGAFSFDGGSSLAALRLDRAWSLDETGRWRMEGAFTLAADLPRGFGERRASILEAGPALLSDWTIGLTHRAPRNLRTRLSLSQPPRAETGRGVLTLPNGRLEDGTRTYETHRFSLVPTRRQITLRLAHQRPFAGGDVVVSVHRTKNRGHSTAPSRLVAGIAWRRDF